MDIAKQRQSVLPMRERDEKVGGSIRPFFEKESPWGKKHIT